MGIDIEVRCAHNAGMHAADDRSLQPNEPVIFTIGHSSLTADDFVRLLRSQGIDVVADVRSQPYSKRYPQYSRDDLRNLLRRAGLRYAFLGDQLGGRPASQQFYFEDGHVNYAAWAASDEFRIGLDRLIASAAKWRIAMVCAEEDPATCHRHLLIARALRDLRGWDPARILHIRSTGRLQTDAEVNPQRQLSLSGMEEQWKSPQSVLHKVQQRASSSA